MLTRIDSTRRALAICGSFLDPARGCVHDALERHLGVEWDIKKNPCHFQ
jgi:hypothetical protein